MTETETAQNNFVSRRIELISVELVLDYTRGVRAEVATVTCNDCNAVHTDLARFVAIAN